MNPINPQLQVPERTSSKRIRDYEDERTVIDKERAEIKSKRIKPSSSFDVGYWTARRIVAEKSAESLTLTKKIFMAKMELEHDKTKEWLLTEEGRKLSEQEAALRLEAKLYEKQEERLKNPDQPGGFHLRRAFLQLFTGHSAGLNVESGRGQRDSGLQSQLRTELLQEMRPEHPDDLRQLYNCPITGLWHVKVTAAHIFPSAAGEDIMTSIFGLAQLDKVIGEPETGQSELFRAVNGILWCEEAEERWSKGFFTIVPSVSDEPSKQEIRAWQESNPKEYKIRILDHKAKLMQMKLLETDRTWQDLDGEAVKFKTDFRPRARYLYFAYCCAMLRQAHNQQHQVVTQQQLRKKFWGTPGAYMRRHMLLGFVEELGHDYEYLLEGAKEGQDEAVETALMVANNQILESNKTQEEKDKEEEEAAVEEESDNDE